MRVRCVHHISVVTRRTTLCTCLCVIYDGNPGYGIMKCSVFGKKLKVFMESGESHN